MNFKSISLLFALALPILSCEKSDPIIPNEEELITTLTYTLTPESGGQMVTLNFKDIDGDGGTAPVISKGILLANTTYTGQLSIMNESVNPSQNITTEISEEGEEHQFFFSGLGGLNVLVSYADKDASGNAIGLVSKLTTGAASSGQLMITLRHEPNKSAMGVAEGLIVNAGGETDIEVSFNVEIK